MGSSGQDLEQAERSAESQLSASRVRSTQAWVLDLLRQAEQRSPTFQQLVTELRATDVIVYVEPGICAFGHLPACLPQPIAVVGGNRYLRVIFDEHHKSANEVLALIGHELQHALEIAKAPEVRTPDAVAVLFRRIGFSPHCSAGVPDCYETDAARLVGIHIQHELSLHGSEIIVSRQD